MAALQGVTPAHLIATVAARKKYRLARSERARSRRRTLERAGKFQPRKKQRVSTEFLYAGEGRFHELLKLAGMSQEDFSRLAGIGYNTVHAWYGFPLHGWAVQLLEHVVWAKNMAALLTEKGWDPEKLRAGHLPPAPDGKYPRTTAQGRALTLPEEE